MLGSIAGDIVGSIFEGSSFNDYSGELIGRASTFTDDSVLICAVSESLANGTDVADELRSWVARYPGRGYGGWFQRWCQTPNAGPYGSYGNGGSVRMGPVAMACSSVEECDRLSKSVAGVTHSSEEALHASTTLARVTFMALNGASKDEIRGYAASVGMWKSASIEEMREAAEFTELASKTVPVAIACTVRATTFEETLRNCIRVGGDTDTIAAMAGGLAEALFGIDQELQMQVESRIDVDMTNALRKLYAMQGRHYPIGSHVVRKNHRPDRTQSGGKMVGALTSVKEWWRGRVNDRTRITNRERS